MDQHLLQISMVMWLSTQPHSEAEQSIPVMMVTFLILPMEDLNTYSARLMHNGLEFLVVVSVSIQSHINCTISIIFFLVGINCGYLATPLNGVVDFVSDTSLGSSAQFSCIRGFRLEGDSVRVCQSNGDYSGEQPSCISELSNIITRKL